MYNPYSLNGKTILVTGASSGIGRATAIECAKLGANVVLTGRNVSRLEETLRMICDVSKHLIIPADLGDEAQIESLVEQMPNVDGLVNNAGISNTKPIGFIKPEDLEKLFGTNAFAPMILTKMLLKKKKLNNGASIVFVSSAASINPDVANSIYSATKAAIASFSRSCAKELAAKQIRSNSVHPGMVQTEMVQNLVFDEEELACDMARYPLKRYGKPEEIAWAIIYLLSDASAWVTGTQLVIDGGVLLA
jgi:NAD(P)-dependent dehydrogenase (short-subunit alcohol dehydrogenase family)